MRFFRYSREENEEEFLSLVRHRERKIRRCPSTISSVIWWWMRDQTARQSVASARSSREQMRSESSSSLRQVIFRVHVEIGFNTSWSSRSGIPTNEYKASTIARYFMITRRISLGKSSRFRCWPLRVFIFTPIRSMIQSLIQTYNESMNRKHCWLREQWIASNEAPQEATGVNDWPVHAGRSLFVNQFPVTIKRRWCVIIDMLLSKYFSLSLRCSAWTERMNISPISSTPSVGCFQDYSTAFRIEPRIMKFSYLFLVALDLNVDDVSQGNEVSSEGLVSRFESRIHSNQKPSFPCIL